MAQQQATKQQADYILKNNIIPFTKRHNKEQITAKQNLLLAFQEGNLSHCDTVTKEKSNTKEARCKDKDAV